jgi:hypothetical protein
MGRTDQKMSLIENIRSKEKSIYYAKTKKLETM